ncbi:MAG: hypothetical protein C0501_23260 [Isosphaera sp.]|nr:hypothetical protein [Isosphaera sp.]
MRVQPCCRHRNRCPRRGLDRVKLPHLTTFSTAAELGSFTGAAKALDLTQAAVSQRVQVLEKSLKKGLFDRRGGRVVLTEAGRKLYAYAQKIRDLHREARKEITGHEPPLTGELELAASSVPGERLLPALLSGFGRKYAHLRVRASVSDSLAVMGQVERGEVSIGLVGRKVAKPHLDFRLLASDRMVLVAAPGHPLIRKKTVTVDQLAPHPLVLREAGSGLRHCFEKALERAGRSLADAGHPRTRQQRGDQGGSPGGSPAGRRNRRSVGVRSPQGTRGRPPVRTPSEGSSLLPRHVRGARSPARAPPPGPAVPDLPRNESPCSKAIRTSPGRSCFG